MPGPDPDGPSETTRSSDGSKTKRKLRAAGSSLMESGRDEMESGSRGFTPVAYRKGGKVRKMKRAKKMRKSGR